MTELLESTNRKYQIKILGTVQRVKNLLSILDGFYNCIGAANITIRAIENC